MLDLFCTSPALDQQAIGVEIDNTLSHEVVSSAAYASARFHGRVVAGPRDFQAQGGNRAN